jgi:type II restriction enzyme
MQPPRIRSAKQLVTSHRAVCEGFLLQAVAKTQRAAPFVEEAREFWRLLACVHDIHTLPGRSDLRGYLLAAAGFSDKAKSHLSKPELRLALKAVIETIAADAGSDWREEIVYRYLLTRGDSLGGGMRNYTGNLARARFAVAIQAALQRRGTEASERRSPSDPDKIQSLTWNSRLLLFDRKPRFIGKNIDAVLLDTSVPCEAPDARLERPTDYIACGELKGGIDPAGADEHWKTARSAIARIRESFRGQPPHLFFIGAAIELSMATEILAEIRKKRLACAANLTVPQQVLDLADWVVDL